MTTTTERLVIGPAEVFQHQLLSTAESEAAARQLLTPSTTIRERCWHPSPELTTIGQPVYRSRGRLTTYAEEAKATNALLYATYRTLYDRVADFFEQRYGLPVDFVDELAIPGFHLMIYPQRGRLEGGGWHFDQVHQQVPYFAERPDEIEAIVNFTLPLAVPSGGTGMDIMEPGETQRQVYVAYRPGVVLFNECELFHRIGASVCREAGESRLTMQGHGVRFRGRVLLFW